MRVLLYWLIYAVFALGAFLHRPSPVRPPVARGSVLASYGPRSLAPIFVAALLIILIGLRYEVGGDWGNYLYFFENIGRQDLEHALARSMQEPGYTLINWLAAKLGAGIWLVNLLCAVPFTVGLMRLSNQQPNPWLALLVATPFLIIVVAMGFTRQAAALGFLMIGVSDFIEKQSLSRFVALTLVGALFHRTVLVFIPVLLLWGGRSFFVSVLLASIAIATAYYTVFSTAIALYEPGYIKSQYDAAGATVRILMNVIPSLILFASGSKFFLSREEKVVWKTFAGLSLLAASALLVVESSVVIDRMALYLIPIQIFVLSRLPYIVAEGRTQLFWVFGIGLYSGFVLFVWLNYAVHSAAWLPYRNYLEP